ncbi:PREDICTED: uncharacterized protein LOC105450199 [Wasmannia auropunctata]|uniref:uncharacterized protein LOC105450199 n=1 Tax=Wasmannia auropunctata TaxID=64793 RepID=UPI0005EF9918|nr:PREDICTED: uncharacterized protein LOC105450199 [Wasmannia auropunctata]
MESQDTDLIPSGTRTPEERREGDACPCPPASATCEGSGAGGTTTPLLKAAIVKVEHVNIDVTKYKRGKPMSKDTSATDADVSMEDSLDEEFERPAPKEKKAKKKDKPASGNSPELEYISTTEGGPSSRPGTSRNQDVELVSYTPGTRSRRSSDSSRASTRKRKHKSSPEDADEEGEPLFSRFTDIQTQAVQDRLEQIEELSSADMAARANEWLSEVESCRGKSKNIKGSFTHKMKVGIAAASGAMKILAMRASMDGDSGFMRAKIAELQKEMKTLKEENQQLKLQIEDLRSGAPVFGETTAEGGAGTFRSPGPSAEFFSPMAEMPQTMEERIGRDLPGTPARPRGSPNHGLRNPPIGDDFFEKLTGAISQAVAGAIKEHMPREEKTKAQGKTGPHKILDRIKRLEKPSPRSETTESYTEDEGLARKQGLSMRQREKRVRTQAVTTREEVPATPAKRTIERTEEGNRNAELPPLVESNRNRPVDRRPPRENAEVGRRRVPRSAAVAMSFPEGMKFAEVVKKARNSVKLDELGIEHTRLRTTLAGAVLVELPGKDMSPKADLLADKLREAFKGSEVRVARPSLRGELRLSGLDASISPEELKAAMADNGGCATTDIRLGQYRITRNGARTVWTQCPLNAAMQLAQEGRLRVGWSTARAVLLKKRPVQCFRCMASGHVRERCPSEVDRSSSCFNCGENGHIARNCGKPPECPICKGQGRRHDHRAGSEACPPCPPRNLRGGSQSPMPQRIPVDRSSAAAPDIEI